MRRAFTLMEVNLAILIMAGGILAMVSLYSLGYRESSQSTVDVEGAALADAVLDPLIRVLSATNVTWTSFKDITSVTAGSGWGYYLSDNGDVCNTAQTPQIFNNLVRQVQFAGGDTVEATYPTQLVGNRTCGLVVQHDRNSPLVRLSFRVTDNGNMLMSMPLYYTEVRFQGVSE